MNIHHQGSRYRRTGPSRRAGTLRSDTDRRSGRRRRRIRIDPRSASLESIGTNRGVIEENSHVGIIPP